MARNKHKNTLSPTVASLTRELDMVNAQMKEAYDRFNYTCESELIDACIFEIESLRARSTYLLRCIKELSGGPKRPVPQAVPVSHKQVQQEAPEEYAAAAVTKGGPLCRS